jgi:hypothetical protein
LIQVNDLERAPSDCNAAIACFLTNQRIWYGVEFWYNPKRRHSSIGMHSPITFETLHAGPDQDH